MSRRLVISLAVVGVAALGCHRQSPELSAADRAALHASEDSLAARLQRGDWTAAAARYSPHAKLMAPNQPMVVGREAIEAGLRKGAPFTTFVLSMDTVIGMGDMAVLWGHYHLSLMVPGVPQAVVDTGKYMQIQWRQPDGSWLTTNEIYNSDLPAAAMAMPAAPAMKKKGN